MAREWNFDGLVGPTHNYAGLASGNLASQFNAGEVSSPKQAALQGLKKMKALADRGYAQGVLPPQLRPRLDILNQLGFTGSTEQVLKAAAEQSPHLLSACYSCSPMWTANAATVSPSSDTKDKKLHFTPANLVSKFHRSIEPEATKEALLGIFQDENYFCVHEALPSAPHLGDEGAANHTRLSHKYGEAGVEFFVYGQVAFNENIPHPRKYVARQTLEASESIIRRHGVKNFVMAQQNPDVIDQGVFHNDVICVGNLNTLLCHEQAFLNPQDVYKQLNEKMQGQLEVIEVPTDKVSVKDSVQSYLFNSQLLQNPKGGHILVAPMESKNNPAVHSYLNTLLENNSCSLSEVLYMDVTQSMKNGGGPACLRLRVVLTEEEEKAINQKVIVNDHTYKVLVDWVNRHYRDELKFENLLEVALVEECKEAMTELSDIFGFKIR